MSVEAFVCWLWYLYDVTGNPVLFEVVWRLEFVLLFPLLWRDYRSIVT